MHRLIYINLEDLSANRSIDGTYDLLQFDADAIGKHRYPPYLSAAVYSVSFAYFPALPCTVTDDTPANHLPLSSLLFERAAPAQQCRCCQDRRH